MELLSPEVIENLRHGRAPRERKIAVCSGGSHLSAADRAEILCVLANDMDETVADRAGATLIGEPVESFIEALKRDNPVPALFTYVAKNFPGKPGVADAMVQNKNCPVENMISVARHLSSQGIQFLMEELDRVTESPALAAAVAHAPALTEAQKNQLQELSGSTIDVTTLAEAVAEAEPDIAKRDTLLQRLAKMNVSQRVQFAMKGGSEARRTLIRDSNKVVQRAVLQSPKLTDQEVEAFAAMASLTDEILRLIAGNRKFRKNYNVVRNLTNNGKTPLDVSLHMLPLLNPIDLKRLTTNKNVPETLRSSAAKLMRTRAELKKG